MFQFDSWFWGLGILNCLSTVVFYALIIWVIYRLISNKKSNKDDKAIEILRERLAKGDITEEEYKIKKELLEKK